MPTGLIMRVFRKTVKTGYRSYIVTGATAYGVGSIEYLSLYSYIKTVQKEAPARR